jgi:hypothetical protein
MMPDEFGIRISPSYRDRFESFDRSSGDRHRAGTVIFQSWNDSFPSQIPSSRTSNSLIFISLTSVLS